MSWLRNAHPADCSRWSCLTIVRSIAGFPVTPSMRASTRESDDEASRLERQDHTGHAEEDQSERE